MDEVVRRADPLQGRNKTSPVGEVTHVERGPGKGARNRSGQGPDEGPYRTPPGKEPGNQMGTHES